MRRVRTAVAVILATLPLASAAVASTSHTHSTGTVDYGGDVLTCPLESVLFSGSGSYVESSTFKEQPNGDRTTAHFLFNLRGVTATGVTSGTQYRVAGVTSTGFSFSFAGAPGADVNHFVQTWHLLPSGGGPPLSFHQVLNLTFNANGQLVAFVAQGPAECD